VDYRTAVLEKKLKVIVLFESQTLKYSPLGNILKGIFSNLQFYVDFENANLLGWEK
jgi:hypothetical protein